MRVNILPFVFDVFDRLELVLNRLHSVAFRLPSALFVHLLTLLLLRLHFAVVVQRLEREILNLQIPKRLDELCEAKFGADFAVRAQRLQILRQVVFHFLLNSGVIVVLLCGVGVELLLKLCRRKRGIYLLDQRAVVGSDEVRIELDNPVEDVFLRVLLHVLEILDEVIGEDVDFIGIPVNLFGKGTTPDQCVDASVKVAAGDVGAVEVHFEDVGVHLKHAFKAGDQKVALLDVEGTGAPDDLAVEGGVDASGQQLGLDAVAFLQPVQDQPEVDLHHLRFDHVVVWDVEGRREFQALYVVHHPHQDLLLHPVVVLHVFGAVVLARGPLEPQLVHPPPVYQQLAALLIEGQTAGVFQRQEVAAVVDIRQLNASGNPILLFLQNPLFALGKPALLYHDWVGCLLFGLSFEKLELLLAEVDLFELSLERSGGLAEVKLEVELFGLLLDCQLRLAAGRFAADQHLAHVLVQHLLEVVLAEIRYDEGRVYFRWVVSSDGLHHFVPH